MGQPGNREVRPNTATVLPFALDNGCFTQGDRFDSTAWLRWLAKLRPYQGGCLFAVVPDVVANAQATLDRFTLYAKMVRELGYRVALVAQDGLESLTVPWSDFDVLFIGGSTRWKLSEHAFILIAEAKRRGKWVHVGRVNSEQRFRAFASVGVDSVDGTYIAFGPDLNGPRVREWIKKSEQQRSLWA